MKKSHTALTAFVVVAVSLYLGLWTYSAQWFKGEIGRLYQNAADDGVEFLGPPPVLSNFPFVPEVHYTMGVKAGNITVLFPELKLRGYPVPFTTLTLDFPQGISLGGIVDPNVWALDTLRADMAIPYRLPAAFTQEDLTAWHERGGKIEIRSYLLTKQALESGGRGLVTLDDKLQPVFLFESVIRHYEKFIADEKEKGLIDPFAAAIGTTLLNSLSKTDPDTNEKTVTVRVSVEHQMLTVGPIQVLPLPEIIWEKR